MMLLLSNNEADCLDRQHRRNSIAMNHLNVAEAPTARAV